MATRSTQLDRESRLLHLLYHRCNDVDDTANRKSKIAQEVLILLKRCERLDQMLWPPSAAELISQSQAARIEGQGQLWMTMYQGNLKALLE